MIYELRIYRCVPGRKPALLSRFENETLRIWEKHGIRQAGFWTTLIGKSSQEITYMLAWDSMAEREKRWGAFLAKELARRAITTQRNSRRKFLPQLGRLLRRRIQRQLRFNQRHFAHNYSGRLQIWPDVVDSLSTLTSTFKGGLGGTLHCTRRKRGNRALGNFSPFRRAWFESLTRAVVSPPLQLNILQPPS